jgi:sigma-B regulation protein RsbU (phosphoserine phosphatase)
MKTLVVENDRKVREWLTSVLQAEGFELAEAENGVEAWDAFERSRLDLIVADCRLPGLDGLELCRRIRSAERTAYPYVILLSAVPGKAPFFEAMKAGADDFIAKPLDPDELRARVRAAQRILTLQARVQALEGILPTCIYCRKIRDEQEVWVNFEQYLTERSSAAFSHGLCPECYSQAAAQLNRDRQ